jgi:zinc transport system substrate-binding protein
MKAAALAFVSLLLASAPAHSAPRVIASIMPIHSIVAAVMGDEGEPELLFSGRQSEHTTAFTPQQLASLGKADLIFLVSHNLERKLGQLSGSEAVNGRTFVELAEAPGVATHTIREGGAWEPEAEEEEDHDHGPIDPHVWLDPANAKAMAQAAAAALASADPAKAETYKANAEAFAHEIDALTAEIGAKLAPVRARPFIVFHDAYQYFERAFGLAAAGSIADVSAAAPSAKRLEEIRLRLKKSNAACVFREPQIDSKFADVVTEGTDAKSGILDPVGADLSPGPAAYPQLLRNLAAAITACLQ